LPEAVFGPGGEAAMRSAVDDVAERSFFVMADACDDARFDEMAASHANWLTAVVRFDEGSCVGEVSCTLPASLAASLFGAFSGRDPDDPAPGADELVDLVGELANMVCGSWLTRAANHQTFTLCAPKVTSWSGGWACAPAAERGLTLSIDELPFVIGVRVDVISDPSAATPSLA